MNRVVTVLCTVVLALVVIGFVLLASASELNSLRFTRSSGETPYYFLIRQAVWLCIAFVACLCAVHFDYHRWRTWPWLTISFYVVVVGLMALVFAFPATKGSHRWIRFGSFALQPSEFAKILSVVATGVVLDRMGWRIERFWKGVVPTALCVVVLMGLTLAEPDFGATMVIAVSAGLLFWLAGMRYGHYGALAVTGLGAVGTLLAFNANRMNRIVAWIPSWLAQAMGVAPEVIAANAEKDANYQLANALVAIRNGGVTGAPGLFKSLQKQEYLPEAHTDFIFAIGAEEWGLVFSLGLLALYVTFFVCGVYIAHRAPDRLGRLFAFGMTFLVFFQAMFNLGVVTGCLPTKGLALPFVSYGGTNLITAMLAVGVLVNIGGQMEPRKPRPRTTRAVVCRKRS